MMRPCGLTRRSMTRSGTKPQLHLVYASQDVFAEEGTRHAQGLSRMLGVTTVILVAPFEMERVDREVGAVGSVPLRADASALSAVDHLLRLEVSTLETLKSRAGRLAQGRIDRPTPANPAGGRRNTGRWRCGEPRGGRRALCAAREQGR